MRHAVPPARRVHGQPAAGRAAHRPALRAALRCAAHSATLRAAQRQRRQRGRVCPAGNFRSD